DVDLEASRQLMMARKNAAQDDLEEGAERVGASIGPVAAPAQPVQEAKQPQEPSAGVVTAAMRAREPIATPASEKPQAMADTAVQKTSGGTVVLDVEQGGIVVPSFVGKSVRAAVQVASSSGLDLDVVGSGVARDQEPVAGAHVAAGSRVVVRFTR